MLHAFNMNGVQFTGIKPGFYTDLTTALGAPTNEIRISPPANNAKNAVRSVSITRIRQKDVTIDSTVKRKPAVVTVNFQLPSDGCFTVAEARVMLADCLAVAAEDTLRDFFKGRI